MRSVDVQKSRPSAQFWLLSALLVLIFLMGGSSRSDVQSLQFLRPLAIVAAAYGLFTMRAAQWRQYRQVALLLTATVLLTASHLVPLPPDVWQQLPGRGIIRDIDALLDLRDQWRPLSMVPAGTLNALYALSIPVAVFCLAAQLSAQDHIRLLMLMIALAIVSGALGLLQSIGFDIQFYAASWENAGLFANRNHQGVLLAMLFPMLAVAASLGDGLGLPPKLSVILAGALAVIAVPLILVTGSRAGLIAALVAILLIPLIGLRGFLSNKGRSRWLQAGKVILPLVVVGLLIWMTIFASRGTALARLETSEDDLRFPVWGSIADMLPVYLPWGSGVGSYADVYQILEPDSLLRPTFSNHAHNEWLEIAFTAGFPGMVIAAWAVVVFFYAGSRALRAPGLPGVFGRLGAGLVVLLAFASTFDYPVRTPIMASVLVIAAVWASSFKRFGIEDGRG